ncbi:p53-like transcription factor [Aaosphaeria arxii CBS 175.79]|uniref:p53-like transcription factor n=1 Tax=Aaosphaeria arxii CBS 175.79 TaxID=1450172 RepID=A0A6A5XLL6_9PLEO|nr:p53-like transcription factor [Aaosphaeria arxii CBS 175.79]KAF2014168.1 p53-like transcription factor [Aaosphaeria arxii CBS 175.79]
MEPIDLLALLRSDVDDTSTRDPEPLTTPIEPLELPVSFSNPFADIANTHEHLPHPEQQYGPTLEDLNETQTHQLLRFSKPRLPVDLLDSSGCKTSISISAQLHGMFFLAESPYTSGSPPLELTCYRRNLFQISGNVVLSRNLHAVRLKTGERIRIEKQEVVVSATESLDGNSIKIVSVPWKANASDLAVTGNKKDSIPSRRALDMINGQDVDSESVEFPISWSRLQFRTATANNGRRKELQQNFVVHLNVVATLATGAQVSICEVHSGAVTVRGRSPKNFQSRKEIPIGVSNNPSSKKGQAAATRPLPRRPAIDRDTTMSDISPCAPQSIRSASVQFSQPISSPTDNTGFAFQYEPNGFPLSLDFLDGWEMPEIETGTSLDTLPSMSLSTPFAPSVTNTRRHTQPLKTPSAPVPLYLVEDEPHMPEPLPSRKQPRLEGPHPPSLLPGTIYSPEEESADMLYEYFPLGLDDWMPRVDAVYRPHVVHQLRLPEDPRMIALNDRSKRYYSQT